MLIFTKEITTLSTNVGTVGTYAVTSDPMTDLRNTIDWVQVELRAVTHADTSGASRSIYIKADLSDYTVGEGVGTSQLPVFLGTIHVDGSVTSIPRIVHVSTFTTMSDPRVYVKTLAGGPVDIVGGQGLGLHLNIIPSGGLAINHLIRVGGDLADIDP